jgi:hypothetical protein
VKFIRSALVLTAATLIPLMPTAAHADRLVQNDAVGDVVSVSGESATPLPDRTEGDIAYSKIRHRDRRVILTMRYRELSTGQDMLHYFAIRTSKMTRYVYLSASTGHWGGVVQMRNAHDKKVRCHVTKKIDYTANTAMVSVPRSCLGKPRWVKVAMAQASYDASSATTFMIDDARANGNFTRPTWSPRVYR